MSKRKGTPGQWVGEFGQVLWFDGIPANVSQAIEEFGVTGMTTNPSILAQAVKDGLWNDKLASMQCRAAEEVLMMVAEEAVFNAARALLPTYKASGEKDGFVSIEVRPKFADDAHGTAVEAKAIRARIALPNVMIKVPATPAGIDAGAVLLREGVPVNFTLIFDWRNYLEVAEAFRRAKVSTPSVASVFVRRTGVAIDAALDELIAAGGGKANKAAMLLGRAAIANAKKVWLEFLRLFPDPTAPRQLPLWASTGNEDPRYPSTHYVEQLIGPDTIDTVPPKTLKAFAESGVVGPTLTRDGIAQQQLDLLAELGIDLKVICANLQADGLRSFGKSWDDAVGLVGQALTSL